MVPALGRKSGGNGAGHDSGCGLLAPEKPIRSVIPCVFRKAPPAYADHGTTFAIGCAANQVNWLIPFLMLSGVQALAAPAPATPATTRSLSLVECIRLALEHNVATASIHHLALAPTANQSSKPSHRTFDRINRSNRILNERQVSSILLIVFILSKILKALPREEGSLPSKLCHPRNGRAVAACL